VAASESGCYMQQTSSLVMDKPDWLVVHAALPTRASLCCMFDEGNRGWNCCSLAVGLYADYCIGCLLEAWSSGSYFEFRYRIWWLFDMKFDTRGGGIYETFSCRGWQSVLGSRVDMFLSDRPPKSCKNNYIRKRRELQIVRIDWISKDHNLEQ
jgi:hypothetical protein